MAEPQASDEAVEAVAMNPQIDQLQSSEETVKDDEVVDADEHVDIVDTSTPDTSTEADLKGTELLKSLLTNSTASAAPVEEKMITTTEVTDETLNLRKILYQPDKEKKDDKELESPTHNGQPTNASDMQNDDDDRLVIDISDEEKGENKTSFKIMPSICNGSTSMDAKPARNSSLDTKTFVSTKPSLRHHQESE